MRAIELLFLKNAVNRQLKFTSTRFVGGVAFHMWLCKIAGPYPAPLRGWAKFSDRDLWVKPCGRAGLVHLR